MDKVIQWAISPWMMALLGLIFGSFINALVFRLPLMMRRGWVRDAFELLHEEASGAHALPSCRTTGPALFGRPNAAVNAPGELIRRLPDGVDGLEQLLAVAEREARQLTLSTPHSFCTHCGHVLRWWELVPVVSWFVLGGKCSRCKMPVSPRYPLVEAFVSATFALLAYIAGPVPLALAMSGFSAALITIALIDCDSMLLPDQLTLPVLVAGLLVAVLDIGLIDLRTAVIGAILGFGGLWLVAKLAGMASSQPVMGSGDLMLVAAIGAWLGGVWLIPLAFIAGVSSLLWRLATWFHWRALARRQLVAAKPGEWAGQARNPGLAAQPFGPHLVVGAMVGVLVQIDSQLAGVSWVDHLLRFTEY